MKRRMTVLLALVAAVGLGAYTIAALLFSGPRGVTLVFQAVAQGDHLVFNDARYDNPRGAGELEINAFRFFVSNLRLEGEEKTYLVPDSYHIVRFDGPDEAFRIHLP